LYRFRDGRNGMTCPHCVGAQKVFGARTARRDLKRFRKKGPIETTRALLDLLPADAFAKTTLLDVGGGVGAVQHEAIARGSQSIIDVDASPAYVGAARSEATARGYVERARYVVGDFVDVANQVPAADVVTLDRVVCCYPDPDALLREAASRAKKYLAMVWPRDRWSSRAKVRLGNLVVALLRNPFRGYVHSDQTVEAPLLRAGLVQLRRRDLGFWQIAVYGPKTATR
jgi:SAM-dependent methyltransferase